MRELIRDKVDAIVLAPGHSTDIDGIFCANGLMGLGVIRYLEDKGKTNILVASYDDVEEARNALRKGTLLATVNQQAEEQGYLGVKYAARVLAGETLPPETFIDVKLVTAETLGEP